MRDLVVGPEPWGAEFWRDAKALAEAHFEEVDGGVDPRRRMDLDCEQMDAMATAGVLKIVTARHRGQMVGYFTWSIAHDVESKGLVAGFQGAWYVAPGHFSVAARMFEASVVMMKDLGVDFILPHHRAQGRGANIGRFFQRRGAKKIQETYFLWIGGDDPCPA